MRIASINHRVKKQMAKYGLAGKFDKQLKLFENNPLHPGLNTEKLEPKSVGLYSFRINKKYRAIFRIRSGFAEIIHVTKHYHN